MDSQRFDDLIRIIGRVTSRRGLLAVLSGAVAAAGVTQIDAVARKQGGPGKKRCKQRNQSCGAGKKCCKGKNLVCTGGTCRCRAGTVPKGAGCVKPGQNPGPNPECSQDADCDGNEVCQNGSCICPGAVKANRCVFACQSTSDCPDGFNSCRGIFPGDGVPREVCVDEPFLLCDGADPCNSTADCGTDEICAFTTCGGFEGSGRCFSILPDN